MKIKDAKPLIGIFYIIDNQIYSFKGEIEEFNEVNEVYDAGRLFHIDLLKEIPNMNPKLSEDIKDKCLEGSRSKHHEIYPRGRVCYDINNDRYEVFANPELLNDTNNLTLIGRDFHLPANKTIFYKDDYYK